MYTAHCFSFTKYKTEIIKVLIWVKHITTDRE